MVDLAMLIDLENLPSDPEPFASSGARHGERRREPGRRDRAPPSIIKQLQRAQFGRRSERLDPRSVGPRRWKTSTPTSAAAVAKPFRRRASRDAGAAVPSQAAARTSAARGHRSRCRRRGVRLLWRSAPCDRRERQRNARLDSGAAARHPHPFARNTPAASAARSRQAPAPERLIAGGLATPALLAQVLVSKYCDHTPLYRQSQIFARHGVDLDRSTLAGWVGGACWWLEALHERLAKNVFASDHLFADDTPVPVLDPGTRPHQNRAVVGVCTRRSGHGAAPEPPAAVYLFAPDRKAERPVVASAELQGRAARRWLCRLRAAHGQRRYRISPPVGRTRGASSTTFSEATGSPIAAEALRRIGELYAIEAQCAANRLRHRLAARRCPVEARRRRAAASGWKRNSRASPAAARLPKRSATRSRAGTASRASSHDGRIELDTNPVERAIRPVASAARTISSPAATAA